VAFQMIPDYITGIKTKNKKLQRDEIKNHEEEVVEFNWRKRLDG
jgi:hypothetical protein